VITIESHTTATNYGSSITIDKPAGMQDGDLLVAHVSVSYSGATVTPPDGWVKEVEGGEEGQSISLFYKKITNAAGEPADYTFTPGGTRRICGAIFCLRGQNIADPWEADATAGDDSQHPEAPSVNAPLDNSMLLCFGANEDVCSYTPPDGMAELYDLNNVNVSCTMAYKTVNSGATGAQTFTVSDGEYWFAASAIINPTAVGIARPLVGGSLASGSLVGKGLAR